MGEFQVNTDNIMIESADIEFAQNVCNTIENTETRNRAIANVLAASVASKCFDSASYSIDTESGLHNIPQVLNDYDVSDFYLNGSYIDVRFYFDGDDITVPKQHFDLNILPVAYMFIKLSEDLMSGTVEGFMLPEAVKTHKNDGFVYKLEETDFVSFHDIKSYILIVDDSDDVEQKLYYQYLDNSIEDKISFYRSLILSKSSREKFIKIAKAQVILSTISNTDYVPKKEEPVSDFGQFGTEDLSESANTTLEESFNYETVATPSIDEEVITEEIQEEFLEQPVEQALEPTPEPEQVSEPESEEKEFESNEVFNNETSNSDEEQIEALFGADTEEDGQTYAADAQEEVAYKKKKSPSFLVAILALAVIAGGAYYGYNMLNNNSANEEIAEDVVTEEAAPAQNNVQSATEAMPIETVENTKVADNKNQGVAVEIPAIERNLDASVLVSNLKIDWEVPSGYASNTSAKRYLLKLGKVIQLNLKTELLLLNRPPISNRITVEIKYNNNSKKFETVGIINSSGEKTVDAVILQTIDKALKMNISVNTDSFGKLQGNPILVIRL